MKQVSYSRRPSCNADVVKLPLTPIGRCNVHTCTATYAIASRIIPVRPPLQEGRYARWAQLLQAAEAAPDSQERILGVCRLMVCFCTDVMRPSTHFADKLTHILERHKLHRCQLGKIAPQVHQVTANNVH